MDYRREVDGLRALAVLPVILFHAGVEAFSGGYVGVDVFFVVSGYLITTIIIAELEQGRFSVVDFYERRARRILPALFLVMLFCIPFAWLWLLPGDMSEFSKSLVAVSLFASNILFWRESDYFAPVAELKPLLHTWSLAVEEQYYVLFPLFLMFFWKYGRRRLIFMLGVVCVVSFTLSQWGAYKKPVAAFYLLPTRGWELLIGAFAAFYLSKSDRALVGRGWSESFGLLGIALVVYAIFSYDRVTPFPGLYALVPALGAVLIILFATERTAVGRFVGNRVFVGIGLVSYSAYLWHQPLLAFIRRSGYGNVKQNYVLFVIIVLLLAYLTWRLVETPFRRRSLFGRRSIFLLSALGAVFFVAFGVVGHRTNGFDGRAHMMKFKDLAYDTSSLGYQGCNDSLSNEDPTLNYCMSASATPNALVVGDSHADDKFYGIQKGVPSFQWKLLGNSSCPPLMGVQFKSIDGTECTSRLAKLFTYIESDPSIKIVVLSFAHMYPLDELIAADHVERHFDPKDAIIADNNDPKLSKVDAFYVGLARTIDFLERRGVRVIVALDIPELRGFPWECLERSVGCHFSKKDVLARQFILRHRIAEIASTRSTLLVFDSLDLFCRDGGDDCSILFEGRSLYRDSHHLTHFGSLMYGELFSEWLSSKLQ